MRMYFIEKLSLAKIEKLLNVSKYFMTKCMKENGLKTRDDTHKNVLYSINEKIFEIIDTEEKAYFLGFLYADGCNYSKMNFVSVSQTIDGKDILLKFQKLLETNKPLVYVKEQLLHNKYLCQPQFRLAITNKKISKDLIKLGCIPKKSLILKFPTNDQVPEYLIRHFMRGYFDGDGCISVSGSKYKSPSFAILGTEQFMESYSKIIEKYTNIKLKTHKRKNIYSLATAGTPICMKILNFLYKDSKIFLNRKYKKYLFWSQISKERLANKPPKTSKFKWIYLSKSENVWMARMSFSKKKIVFGRSKSELETLDFLNDFYFLINQKEKIQDPETYKQKEKFAKNVLRATKNYLDNKV